MWLSLDDQETKPNKTVRYSMKVQSRALPLGVVRNVAQRFLKESKVRPIDLTSKNKLKREKIKSRKACSLFLSSVDDGNNDYSSPHRFQK